MDNKNFQNPDKAMVTDFLLLLFYRTLNTSTAAT
jgi:hypothetical protein